MDCKTNASNLFMFNVYREKLVASGVPGNVASVVAATKYTPCDVADVVCEFAGEQAAIASALGAFNRVAAAEDGHEQAKQVE